MLHNDIWKLQNKVFFFLFFIIFFYGFLLALVIANSHSHHWSVKANMPNATAFFKVHPRSIAEGLSTLEEVW